MGENDRWRGFEKKINGLLLVFLELDVFLSMFPSMLKGEIVASMNFDDIPMGEYYYDDMLYSWLSFSLMST